MQKVTRIGRRKPLPRSKDHSGPSPILANPRISPARGEIEVWAESLCLRFQFTSYAEAETFGMAALKSTSVSAVNFFKSGKFVGARDGAAA